MYSGFTTKCMSVVVDLDLPCFLREIKTQNEFLRFAFLRESLLVSLWFWGRRLDWVGMIVNPRWVTQHGGEVNFWFCPFFGFDDE